MVLEYYLKYNLKVTSNLSDRNPNKQIGNILVTLYYDVCYFKWRAAVQNCRIESKVVD